MTVEMPACSRRCVAFIRSNMSPGRASRIVRAFSRAAETLPRIVFGSSESPTTIRTRDAGVNGP